MLLDSLTWLAANLGLLESPTPIRSTLLSAPPPSDKPFRQQVANAIIWALAVQAEDMVIHPANTSTQTALPWLVTSASSAFHSPSPLQWWISVHRPDGDFKLLFLRPRALPLRTRRQHDQTATGFAGIRGIAIPPPMSTQGVAMPVCDSSLREQQLAPVNPSSITTAHRVALSSSISTTSTIPERGYLSNRAQVEWFRSCSSSSSNDWNHAPAVVPDVTVDDDFDLPFGESEPLCDDGQDSGFDLLTGSAAVFDSRFWRDDCDDMTSVLSDNSSTEPDSLPPSPRPIHVSRGQLGLPMTPHVLPRRIETPMPMFDSQTPSAPPTPTPLGSYGSISPLLLVGQSAPSIASPATTALCRFPTGSSTTTLTPSPPLTPRFQLLNLAPPTSPPLTCPLPLPEAAVSELAVAADGASYPMSPIPITAGSVSPSFAPQGTIIHQPIAHGPRQDCFASAPQPLSAGSVLFA